VIRELTREKGWTSLEGTVAGVLRWRARWTSYEVPTITGKKNLSYEPCGTVWDPEGAESDLGFADHFPGFVPSWLRRTLAICNCISIPTLVALDAASDATIVALPSVSRNEPPVRGETRFPCSGIGALAQRV